MEVEAPECFTWGCGEGEGGGCWDSEMRKTVVGPPGDREMSKPDPARGKAVEGTCRWGDLWDWKAAEVSMA